MLNDSSPPYPRADHLLFLPCDMEPPRRMDQQQQASSSGRGGPTTPRRQLQGPRPPRLNVRMESHAIKKPAAAPVQALGQARSRDQQPVGRAPVIIYDASPKVIHAKPSEFMALVQRLTGPGSGAPASEHHRPQQQDDDDGMLGQPFLPPELLLSPSAAMSPAARLATIERSVRPLPTDPASLDYDVPDDSTLAAVLGAGPARHPGILSPLPSTLPPAAASGAFSPQPSFLDAGCISWLNELSPILRAAAPVQAGSGGAAARAVPPPHAYYSDPFVPSPRHLLATPTIPSPTTCAEFFGSLPDF